MGQTPKSLDSLDVTAAAPVRGSLSRIFYSLWVFLFHSILFLLYACDAFLKFLCRCQLLFSSLHCLCFFQDHFFVHLDLCLLCCWCAYLHRTFCLFIQNLKCRAEWIFPPSWYGFLLLLYMWVCFLNGVLLWMDVLTGSSKELIVHWETFLQGQQAEPGVSKSVMRWDFVLFYFVLFWPPTWHPE